MLKIKYQVVRWLDGDMIPEIIKEWNKLERAEQEKTEKGAGVGLLLKDKFIYKNKPRETRCIFKATVWNSKVEIREKI